MSSVYSLEISNIEGKKVLKFGGDLVINHIDKMAKEVKEALSEPTDVSVEIDNPENIDMTFLQLVIAIRHTSKEGGKAFSIKTTLKEDLKELVEKAGLSKELNL